MRVDSGTAGGRVPAGKAPSIAARRVHGRRLLALAALLPLGACGTDRYLNTSSIPEDYNARHPIVLRDAPVGIEVFATAGKLDETARARVTALAGGAASEGEGGIEVLFPQGAVNEAQQRAALPAIRHALAAGGAKGYVSVGAYPVADPSLPAPVRLSYRAIRARVASQCGDWPADLASASTLETWKNRPYWNMGCSYQNMIASQVSDPRDLVEPRATGNGDVEMRIRAIGRVRQGSDPATSWTVKNSSIGSVGGN